MRQDFLFSTGRSISFEPINPRIITIFEIQRQKDKPKPPEEVVEAEGPLQGTTVVNDADPDYQDALAAYMAESEQKRTEFYIRRAKFEPKGDEWKKEVKEYRDDMKAVGVDITEENDVILWITDLACGDQDEFTDFMSEVTNSHAPSAERRAALRDSFRTDVQGA